MMGGSGGKQNEKFAWWLREEALPSERNCSEAEQEHFFLLWLQDQENRRFAEAHWDRTADAVWNPEDES